MKRTILFVHPGKDEVKRANEAFGSHFEVLPIRQPEIAMATIRTLRPWGVVASLQQNRMNGLELAKDLRERIGGFTCRFIVYGKPESDGATLATTDIESMWGLDKFIEAEDDALSVVSDYLITASQVRTAPSPVHRAPEPPVTEDNTVTWGEMLAIEAPQGEVSELLREELFGSREVIPVCVDAATGLEPVAQDTKGNTAGFRLMTWSDLLHAPASKSSVKAMLTRPLWGK